MTDDPQHRVVAMTEPAITLPGESVGMRQAKRRPADFETLSPRAQWAIDKTLGILDWDGT
jgi:hypothetical protein